MSQKIILKTIYLTIVLTLVSCKKNNNRVISKENQYLIGTWVVNNFPDNKWVFLNSGKCYSIKNSVDTLKFNYILSKKALSCKKYNPIIKIEYYLFLFNNKTRKDTLCYEVLFNKLDTNELGIRFLPLEAGAYGILYREK